MELTTSNPLRPFLKWPGGKRWFAEHHSSFFPQKFNRYIEPFLGSGSVFFYLRPCRALLGDINQELIGAYLGIRNSWKQVDSLLKKHQKWHSNSHYYKMRASRMENLGQKSARLIYLNRTCFNGIFRVNHEGQFNVPKGTRDSVLFETDDFQETSDVLQSAEIRVCDFQKLVDEAKRNDFIFADPPYTVRHNLNGFIKYNENLFSWYDQVRLADALQCAKKRGVKIVCTNANHESVREIYRERGFFLKKVSRFSCISASSQSRKQFEELVIFSHPGEKF
jgi:DNA adenine methylase